MEVLECGSFVNSGNYSLHSSFTKVLNYQKDNELISLVTKTVGGGPNNIVLSHLPLEIRKSINIQGATISLLDKKIALKKVSYSLDDVLINDVFVLQERLKNIMRKYSRLFVPKSLAFLIFPSFEANFTSAFDSAFKSYILNSVNSAKDIFEFASLFKGAGSGLTPAGDDFNTGVLYALNYLKRILHLKWDDKIKEYYKKSLGKNLISNTFLKYAYLGQLYEPFYFFLKELKDNDDNFIYEYLNKLLNKGHSSGSDMVAGFVYSINEILKLRSEI